MAVSFTDMIDSKQEMTADQFCEEAGIERFQVETDKVLVYLGKYFIEVHEGKGFGVVTEDGCEIIPSIEQAEIQFWNTWLQYQEN